MLTKLVVPICVAIGVGAGLLITYSSETVVLAEDAKAPARITPSDNVVVVDISSILRKREKVASAIEAVCSTEPRGIALDVFFDPAVESPETETLRKALSKANCPVLVMIGAPSDVLPVTRPIFSDLSFLREGYFVSGRAAVNDTGNVVTGIQAWEPSTDPPVITVPSLPILLACLIENRPLSTVGPFNGNASYLEVDGRHFTLNEGCLPIAAPTGAMAYTGAKQADDIEALRDIPSGRVIVFGDLVNDKRFVPGGKELPGTQILINAADTLNVMIHGQLRYAGFWEIIIWMSFCSLVATLSALLRSPWLAVGCTTLAVTASANSPQILAWLGYAGGLIFAPLAATVVSGGLALGSRAFQQDSSIGRDESFDCAVLFVDAVNSTEKTLSEDAVRAAERNREFLNAIGRVISKRDGVIETTLGDGVYARFRHRNPATATQRAVSAAQDLTAKGGVSVAGELVTMRAAVEFGPVVARTVNVGALKTVTTGQPVNLSSRLIEIGKQTGRSLVIGPSAAQLISITCQSLGEFEVRGFSEQIEVFSV